MPPFIQRFAFDIYTDVYFGPGNVQTIKVKSVAYVYRYNNQNMIYLYHTFSYWYKILVCLLLIFYR